MKTVNRVYCSNAMAARKGGRIGPNSPRPGILAGALKESNILVVFLEPIPLREEESQRLIIPEMFTTF